MGKILGVATTLSGKFASQNSTYGSAQRGKPIHTEIIISDKLVKFAFIQKPDFFIVMDNQGFNKYNNKIGEKTIVFTDLDKVKDIKMDSQENYISLPASKIAKEMGLTIGANFVMLGKFISISKIIPLKIVEEAMMQNISEQSIKKNLEALRKGYTI